MTPPAEPLTYDDLSGVCRSEQRLKNLVEVRIDFYPAIRECRERLKADYEREYAVDPFSTKAKLAGKALTEFTDMVELTFDARMKKILAMALRASEGNKIETTKLTREEKELFDTIYVLMKDRHASLIDGRPGRGRRKRHPRRRRSGRRRLWFRLRSPSLRLPRLPRSPRRPPDLRQGRPRP